MFSSKFYVDCELWESYFAENDACIIVNLSFIDNIFLFCKILESNWNSFPILQWLILFWNIITTINLCNTKLSTKDRFISVRMVFFFFLCCSLWEEHRLSRKRTFKLKWRWTSTNNTKEGRIITKVESLPTIQQKKTSNFSWKESEFSIVGRLMVRTRGEHRTRFFVLSCFLPSSWRAAE